MRLVGKAGVEGRVGNTHATFQFALPVLYAAVDQVGVGR
tara:strand:- start:1 stop:117 length:117 start_codon:yes stop_codon:yes gene_type:complete